RVVPRHDAKRMDGSSREACHDAKRMDGSSREACHDAKRMDGSFRCARRDIERREGYVARTWRLGIDGRGGTRLAASGTDPALCRGECRSTSSRPPPDSRCAPCVTTCSTARCRLRSCGTATRYGREHLVRLLFIDKLRRERRMKLEPI